VPGVEDEIVTVEHKPDGGNMGTAVLSNRRQFSRSCAVGQEFFDFVR
jgi:hypothetical protein